MMHGHFDTHGVFHVAPNPALCDICTRQREAEDNTRQPPTMAQCQQSVSDAAITDEQMYTAFAAEHLATACRCLAQAIDEQPDVLAYLRAMLERWRRDVATLEAEAKTKVVEP